MLSPGYEWNEGIVTFGFFEIYVVCFIGSLVCNLKEVLVYNFFFNIRLRKICRTSRYFVSQFIIVLMQLTKDTHKENEIRQLDHNVGLHVPV